MQLERPHFTIGRGAEYFSADELEKQTGVARTSFAAAAVKELVDNALDAAETARVAPDIALVETRTTAGELTIRVRDNGPGLAEDVIRRILDFDSRTSDKIGHKSPTRGLQGNALKTVVGMPVALGGDAPLVIESRGLCH